MLKLNIHNSKVMIKAKSYYLNANPKVQLIFLINDKSKISTQKENLNSHWLKTIGIQTKGHMATFWIFVYILKYYKTA